MWCDDACVCEGVCLVHRLNRKTVFPRKKIRRVDNLPGESPASRHFFFAVSLGITERSGNRLVFFGYQNPWGYFNLVIISLVGFFLG